MSSSRNRAEMIVNLMGPDVAPMPRVRPSVVSASFGSPARLLFHDLEASGFQLPDYRSGQMRALLRHDPAWTSPIGIVFSGVAAKGRTNALHNGVCRV
jgi:hypothetical protein